jgi:hypothetical protein
MRAIAALQVIETGWRLVPALRAFAAGGRWKRPAHRYRRILVWRHNSRVFYREIDELETRAIAMLRRGSAFGAICAALSKAISRERGDARWASDAAAAINAILTRWLRDGIVAAPAPRKRRKADRTGYSIGASRC